MNSHQEAQLLFLVGDREPVFQQDDAGAHQHPLELGHILKKLFNLVFGGEPHDTLDPGTVVPGPVKEHHLTAGGKVRYIALEIPLRHFPVGRFRQRHGASHPRVEPLRDALDHTALAGAVASLAQDQHLGVGRHNPVLELDHLCLKAQQVRIVDAPVQTIGMLLLV